MKKSKKSVKKPKKSIKRPSKKGRKTTPKKVDKKIETKPIGKITHFYGCIGVAIIKFTKPVNVGDSIQIKGATTDFTQKISSMQFDHKEIETAKKGQEVGIKQKIECVKGTKYSK